LDLVRRARSEQASFVIRGIAWNPRRSVGRRSRAHLRLHDPALRTRVLEHLMKRDRPYEWNCVQLRERREVSVVCGAHLAVIAEANVTDRVHRLLAQPDTGRRRSGQHIETDFVGHAKYADRFRTSIGDSTSVGLTARKERVISTVLG